MMNYMGTNQPYPVSGEVQATFLVTFELWLIISFESQFHIITIQQNPKREEKVYIILQIYKT